MFRAERQQHLKERQACLDLKQCLSLAAGAWDPNAPGTVITRRSGNIHTHPRCSWHASQFQQTHGKIAGLSHGKIAGLSRVALLGYLRTAFGLVADGSRPLHALLCEFLAPPRQQPAAATALAAADNSAAARPPLLAGGQYPAASEVTQAALRAPMAGG